MRNDVAVVNFVFVEKLKHTNNSQISLDDNILNRGLLWIFSLCHNATNAKVMLQKTRIS